ncbi:hypothetical protein, partial [Methanosarcina mazei]|uniref:hypothetical protein n=1 Tax=Methanosarcina mazei TaxID=2209 RepID=UPI001F2E7666
FNFKHLCPILPLMMLGSAIIEPLPSENLKSYFNHSLGMTSQPLLKTISRTKIMRLYLLYS